MKEQYDFFRASIIAKAQGLLEEAMQQRGMGYEEVAEKINDAGILSEDISAEALIGMFQDEHLCLGCLSSIFVALGYKPMLTLAPVSDRDREVVEQWSKS